VADIEGDRRRLLPAIIDALERMIEEALLQRQAIARGEQRLVGLFLL